MKISKLTEALYKFRNYDSELFNPRKSVKLGSLKRKRLSESDIKVLNGCFETTLYLSKNAKKEVEKGNFYISLTSQPDRLLYLPFVLSTINLDHFKEVVINLPAKYKNKEEYDPKGIDFVKKLHPKIKVYRPRKDIGPGTKIVPTISRLQKKNPSAVCISIDDDIAYTTDLFTKFINKSISNHKKIVWGSHGFDIGEYYKKLNEITNWPAAKSYSMYSKDVIEGFAGIVYPVKLFDAKTVRKLANLSMECKLSDDWTISFTLGMDGVQLRELPERDFTPDHFNPDYGGWLEPLKFGEIKGLHTEKPPPGFEGYNIYKYYTCWVDKLEKRVKKK